MAQSLVKAPLLLVPQRTLALEDLMVLKKQGAVFFLAKTSDL